MGITNTASLDTDQGNSLDNTYACFASDSIEIIKVTDDNFSVNGVVCFFIDKTAKDNNKKPVLKVPYRLTGKTKNEIANPYALLYAQLKSDYPNYTDDE